MRTFAVAAAALILAATMGSASVEARTRHGRGGRPVVVVGGYYGPYAPFYGWGQYAFGFAPYYGYGFGLGYGVGCAPFYGPYRYDDSASARVQVKPKQTEVYVDGYLAGRVDDFDGTFQRRYVRPGGHQITLYLDGQNDRRFHPRQRLRRYREGGERSFQPHSTLPRRVRDGRWRDS